MKVKIDALMQLLEELTEDEFARVVEIMRLVLEIGCDPFDKAENY